MVFQRLPEPISSSGFPNGERRPVSDNPVVSHEMHELTRVAA